MKKWLVALLVALALLLLISPGIVGLIAERGLREAVDEAGRGTPEIAVTTERFDREWFSSAGRHRVELKRGELYVAASGIAREAGEERLPALIIDTELQHGIRPFGESGSLMPMLASSVSTLQFETAAGDLVDIPGTIRSEVGLTGTTRSHYLLEAGTFKSERAHGNWDGADLRFSITPTGSWATLSGTVGPWALESDVSSIRAGSVTIDAEAEDSDFGFRTGSLLLDIVDLSANDANESVALQGLRLQGESDISGSRLSAETEMHIDRLTLPTVGEAAADITVRTRHIDARTLQRVLVAMRTAKPSPDVSLAMDALDDDLILLLSKGIQIDVQRFDISLPQGGVSGTLSLDLPKSNSDEAKPWSSLVLQATASVDLEIDADLMQFAQSVEPNIGSLIGLGYLRPSGDKFKLAAEVDGGQLKINGAPMSIPTTLD